MSFFKWVGVAFLAVFALRVTGVIPSTGLAAGIIILIVAYQVAVQTFPAARSVIALVFVGAVVLATAATFLGPYTGFSRASFKRWLKDKDLQAAAELLPQALGSRAEALSQIQEIDDITSTRDARELEAVKAAYERGQISVDSAYKAIGRILDRAEGRAQLIRETSSRLSGNEPGKAQSGAAPASASRVIVLDSVWVDIPIPRRHEFDVIPVEGPVLIRRTDGEVFERTPDGRLLRQGKEVQDMGWPIPGYIISLRSKSGGDVRTTFSAWPER